MDTQDTKELSSDQPAIDIGSVRYWMLVCAVLGQLATVIITWELWHCRADPPNLPVFDLPQPSFGIWVVLSLMLVLLKPRQGLCVHIFLLIVTSVFDQFRMQPQFLALVFLMWAAVSEMGLRIGRWFLATLWLWAGIHKLLSPHWFAHAGHWMLLAMGMAEDSADQWHWHFSAAVGVAEILAGVAAIFRPRLAAVLASAMHLSIFILLIFIHWNFSVLPWNLATAIVGAWIMWEAGNQTPTSAAGDRSKIGKRVLEFAIVTLLFIAPVGFFWSLLDHGYANVLYSDFVPRALITSQKNGLREISGWHPIHVPFPYERRTHRQFFEALANEGDKLHIHDPRTALEDQFFLMSAGKARPIDAEEFFESRNDSVAGVAIDDRCARFWLRKIGIITKRKYQDQKSHTENLVSYAYTMKPENYSPENLLLLTGLPNLEQLDLSGCSIVDADLALLKDLKNLQGIGLSNTPVTDEGLKHLGQLPKLRILMIENTQISPGGLQWLKEKLGL